MPLRSGTAVVAPPTSPPADVGFIQAPPPAIDLEALAAAWTAPDGTVWPLTSRSLGWWTGADAVYAGAAPVNLAADPNPRYGARVRHVQPQPRVITWPLRVQGATHTEFIARWRQLAHAFTQTRRLGAGTLALAQPDGSARQIRAWYHSGFDQVPRAGWSYDTAILSLYCEDPYWSDTTPTVVTRTYQAAGASFISPSFPKMSSSQTLGATVANNPGDVEAWPVWTITGPASAITATNNTTGEAFTLTPVGGAMTGGQVATITTDPPSIIGTDGVTSWVGGLNWPSAVLWALQPGDNNITFTVTGSAAGTKIVLTFYPRYETA
jgi:hypothetical protein